MKVFIEGFMENKYKIKRNIQKNLINILKEISYLLTN